jgi:hypothetical protein
LHKYEKGRKRYGEDLSKGVKRDGRGRRFKNGKNKKEEEEGLQVMGGNEKGEENEDLRKMGNRGRRCR